MRVCNVWICSRITPIWLSIIQCDLKITNIRFIATRLISRLFLSIHFRNKNFVQVSTRTWQIRFLSKRRYSCLMVRSTLPTYSSSIREQINLSNSGTLTVRFCDNVATISINKSTIRKQSTEILQKKSHLTISNFTT